MTYANGILQETPSGATGTGDLALNELSSFRAFTDEFSTGGTDVFKYFIRNKNAEEMEFGTGHIDGTSGDLVRDTVLWSTNSNSLVSFTSGVKVITNDCAEDSSGNLRLGQTQFDGATRVVDDTGFSFGTNDDYTLQYSTANTRLELANGSGNILQVDDGQVDVDFQGALTTDGRITAEADSGGLLTLNRPDGNNTTIDFKLAGAIKSQIQQNSNDDLQIFPAGNLDLTGSTVNRVGTLQFSDASGDGDNWEITEDANGNLVAIHPTGGTTNLATE